MHMEKRIIRLFAIACILVCTIIGATGCSTIDRTVVNIKSDISGGLQRTITVYTADGKEMATYEGKIDIETTSGGYVKFDFDGKRYIYYNCFVETIADIN